MIWIRAFTFLAFTGALQAQQFGGSWDSSRTVEGSVGDSFGYTMTAMEDVDLDGVPDFAVSSLWRLHSGGRGGLDLISGRTLAPIWQYHDPNTSFFGIRLARIGDVDTDGVSDLLVAGNSGGGRVVVISGRTGGLIREHVEQAPPYSDYGSNFCSLGDVDGDGVTDYGISDHKASTGPWTEEGLLECYSGATGVLLWRSWGRRPHRHFGGVLAALPDLNSDGAPEVLTTELGYPTPPDFAHVLDGATGERIVMRPIFESGATTLYAFRLAHDHDGDGLPEVAMVTDGVDREVRLWSWTSGTVHWRRPVEWTYGAVRLDQIGDLNQDGVEDLTYFRSHPGVIEILSGIDGGVLGRLDVRTSLGPANALMPIMSLDLEGDGVHEILTSDFRWGGGSSSSYRGQVKVHQFDPFLRAQDIEVSAAQGGGLSYRLDFPASEAGRHAGLFVSLRESGTSVIFGVPVSLASSSLRPVAWAQLDGLGDATLQFQVAPGRLDPLVGRELLLAAVTQGGSGGLASAPAPLTVLP